MGRYDYDLPMERSNAYQPQDLLPIGKAARYAGISKSTLRRYTAAGHITPRRTIGGHTRYAVEDLNALRERQSNGDAA